GDPAEQRVAVALLGDLGNPSAAQALLQVAAGPQAAHGGGPVSEPKTPSGPRRGAVLGALSGPGGVVGGVVGGPGGGLGGLSASGLGGRAAEAPGQGQRTEIDLRVAALLQAARLADPRGIPTLLR